MHQQASGPNSAQVEGGIINSTVNITQSNVAGNAPQFVQLELDSASVQRYSKSEIEQKALRGGVVVAIPFITALMGYFADGLEILNSLGWGRLGTIYVSFMVGMILATLGMMVEHRSMEGLYYWIKSGFMRRNEGKLIGLGKFVEIDRDGNYLTYSLSGYCVYPVCNGRIIAVDVPPREKHRAPLAGMCSVAGEAHSYLIDYNAVAVPKELDWRPLDPQSYNSGYRR
jgi:hypothetical protein